MRFTDTLPTPCADALSHSNTLTEKIRAAIEAHQGKLSFREFMRMALYEPQLGYYVAGLRKIGQEGDFITAPELSAFFSQCVANQCAEVLNYLTKGAILEIGAGSGIMAATLLAHLEHLQTLPECYYILDVSPELRDRQRRTLQERVPHLIHLVQWLDTLPTTPINGVIVGNEVLDAMPVELFTLVHNERVMRNVIWTEDGFDLDATQGEYTSEFNPNLPAWMQSIADCLNQGIVLLIDYGYEAHDYYHPERNQGTLVCHYQHRVHYNPLIYVGLQDITASVDFTAVADAGLDAGLELAGYTSQAAFLANTGLETLFVDALNTFPEKQYHFAQQIRTLSLPSEMGERFKVIAFSKNFTHALQGFKIGDWRHRL